MEVVLREGVLCGVVHPGALGRCVSCSAVDKGVVPGWYHRCPVDTKDKSAEGAGSEPNECRKERKEEIERERGGGRVEREKREKLERRER